MGTLSSLGKSFQDDCFKSSPSKLWLWKFRYLTSTALGPFDEGFTVSCMVQITSKWRLKLDPRLLGAKLKENSQSLHGMSTRLTGICTWSISIISWFIALPFLNTLNSSLCVWKSEYLTFTGAVLVRGNDVLDHEDHRTDVLKVHGVWIFDVLVLFETKIMINTFLPNGQFRTFSQMLFDSRNFWFVSKWNLLQRALRKWPFFKWR